MELSTFNRSAIMKRAWEISRKGKAAREKLRAEGVAVPDWPHHHFFANALRTAWSEAKQEKVAERLRTASTRPYTGAEAELFELRMKDRWTPQDYRRAHQLKQAAA